MSLINKFSKKQLKILFIIIIFGILIEFSVFFDFENQIIEADFEIEKNTDIKISDYLVIQSNSFVSISDISANTRINKTFIKTVTAYNPVAWQTDEEPCISASGMNICKTEKKICASNEFPFGTELLIADEIWEVQDRMHPRYSHRIDLFFKTKQEVRDWGKRTVEVVKLD